MLRQNPIHQYWQYLPTFRVVAEMGNVKDAARLLSLTPSAVSKTLLRLEDALGESVFYRRGGKFALTPLGERLLGCTRAALRSIDDARADSHFSTVVRVSVHNEALFVVGRAIGRTEPMVNAIVVELEPGESADALLIRGQTDLAIVKNREGKKKRECVEIELGQIEVIGDGENSMPLATAIGLALAGRSVPLPAVLAARLGLELEKPGALPVLAVMRRPAPQGTPLTQEIERLVEQLQIELGKSGR